MAIDPYHRHSNEAGRFNKDIYDNFKLKLTLCSPGSYKTISAL